MADTPDTAPTQLVERLGNANEKKSLNLSDLSYDQIKERAYPEISIPEFRTPKQIAEDGGNAGPQNEILASKSETPEPQPQVGLTVDKAREIIGHYHSQGEISDDTLNHLSALEDEQLVKSVISLRESILKRRLEESQRARLSQEATQALGDMDQTAKEVIEDAKKEDLEIKYQKITEIIAKKLEIPKNSLDVSLVRKVSEKITEAMDLSNMSEEQIRTGVEALFEDDEEFQDYSLKLYKQQLYQTTYESKKKELEDRKLIESQYPPDYIEQESVQAAQKAVAEFEKQMNRKKDAKQKIQNLLEENAVGIFGLLVNVLVPEILNEMKGK